MQDPFDLKGSAFTIPMLSLRESNMEIISARLAKKVGQAPSFFRNAPVVLDFGQLPDPDQVDINKLLDLVRERGFIPVGITNCTEDQQRQAKTMELAVLTTRGNGRLQEEKAEEKQEEILPDENANKPEPAMRTVSAATVITEPIRSGQRIFVEQGDLIVLTSVGSGAEVTAAGNIHVYGALRGRAFAGNTGDTQARIFCQQLEAELVAVAGIYLVNENFPDSLRAQPVHIRLQTERIRITPL
ncbi:MAG: septum site-determining protein MinC [Candidatus Electrothrix communis]|nr:septum site-determining protein MinC [Desulfobulbus sp. US4]WLE95617.1 MAG: septum site-determining protein MinC [Candidatus Electrothrix communis]